MADNKKKSFLEYYIESKKLNKDIKNLEKGIDKETKENTENNINFWDILDTQTGARKVLPGPSMTELQESQLKKIMDPDYKRPISHTIKDSVATVGPAAVSAATKVVSGPIMKKVAGNATKSTISNILDRISRGIGKITNYDYSAKLGDEGIVNLAKKANDTNYKAVEAARNLSVEKGNKHVQDALADYFLESMPERDWPRIMNKPYIDGKKIESLEKAKKFADYQRDTNSSDLLLRLYDTLEKEFGDVKGVVALKDRTYDLEYMKDLYDLAFKDPDKLRLILDQWDTMQKLHEKSPNTVNLSSLYDAYKNSIWANSSKKANKELNREEAEDFADFLSKFVTEHSASKVIPEDYYFKNMDNTFIRDASEQIIKKGKMPNKAEMSRIQNAILKSAKKRYKGRSLFEKIMNPSDPIYKTLVSNSDEILSSNEDIIRYLNRGDSFEEAIQNSLLDYIFDKADKNYRTALYEISRGTPHPDLDRVLKGHPFRRPDGSIKSEEEIIKAISKDPFYEKAITDFMESTLKTPARDSLYAGAKSTEMASVPLLANYITRTAKNASSRKNDYDPFNKKSIEFLPPELQPWNPDIESTYTDRFWENVGNVLGVNWSGDPNRFTKSQLKMVRQALVDVAKETGFESPKQIEALSKSEVLTLLRKVGDGKYGNEIADKVKSVANNMIDSQKENREQKLEAKQKQLKDLEDSQNKKGD